MSHATVGAGRSGVQGGSAVLPARGPVTPQEESVLARSRSILAAVVPDFQPSGADGRYDGIFRQFVATESVARARLGFWVRFDSASMLLFSILVAVASYRTMGEAALVFVALFVGCFLTARFPSARTEIRTRWFAAETSAGWIFLVAGALLYGTSLHGIGDWGMPFRAPDRIATYELALALLPLLLFFSAARVFVMAGLYRWGGRGLGRRDLDLVSGAIVVNLAHALLILQDPDFPSKKGAVVRADRWIGQAEKLIVNELWRHVDAGIDRHEFREKCGAAGRTLADQRNHLLADRVSRLAARSVVVTTIVALTERNLRELPCDASVLSTRRRLTAKAITVLRILLSAFLPWAAFIALRLVQVDLPDTAWTLIVLYATGWSALCVAPLVDPDFDRRFRWLRTLVPGSGEDDD